MNYAELTDEQIEALRRDLDAQIESLKERRREVVVEHNARLLALQIKSRHGEAGRLLLETGSPQEVHYKLSKLRAEGKLQESKDSVVVVPDSADVKLNLNSPSV